MPATSAGPASEGPDPNVIPAYVTLGFGAAFRALEIADRVSENFDNAVRPAITFILGRAHGALHHHTRTCWPACA
jgi:hypothetical protein